MVAEDTTEGLRTEGAGGNMVFVKVRETYDLHTTQNKMTVISVHTPRPDILKKNYPGLLMQCRAYRPYSCDVRIACATVLPMDPQGVGTSPGDVAPEDIFNPILYKAMTNKGMSQLEARINALTMGHDSSITPDVNGNSALVEVNETTNQSDEFGVYYGLLANSNGWKKANPQSGVMMSDLKPLVFDIVYNTPDQITYDYDNLSYAFPKQNGDKASGGCQAIIGNAKPMPFLNCTSYSLSLNGQVGVPGSFAESGFPNSGFNTINNCEVDVPYVPVCVAGLVIPPSRLHSLYYRMVVEWTIEFSAIRPIGEITDWVGLGTVAGVSHYQNYSYSSTKEALTGDSDSIMDSDTCMVSANVDVEKVM